MNNSLSIERSAMVHITFSFFALALLLTASATAHSQTVLSPTLQARFGATTTNLGKVQDSIIYEPEEMASRQFGFVAGDHPEEFRNIAIFRLDDTGLTSADVSKASLEIVAPHQVGEKTPSIAVAQLLRGSGESDFVLNNFNMFQEPEGEPLQKEGEWSEPHSIDITNLLKSALDESDESRGLIFRVWLLSDETGHLVDYQNQEIKTTSLGTVEISIEVQKKP